MEKSEARKALDKNSTAFIQDVERSRAELQSLIQTAEQLRSQSGELSKKTTAGMIAGQVTLGVAGVMGICAAPFTGGLSLALAGLAAATGVAGGGATLGVHLKNRSSSEEIDKTFRRIREVFRQIIESLKSRLDTVVPSVMNLRREYNAVKQDLLISCETRIRTSVVTTFTGDVSLPEAKELFSNLLKELEELSSLLQDLSHKLDTY